MSSCHGCCWCSCVSPTLLPVVTDRTWLLLNVSTELLILLGIHILVHKEMNSQLPCKTFRKRDKSLLSTFITNHGVEMALSTTAAFLLGQAVLPLPAESMLEAVLAWRNFVLGKQISFLGSKVSHCFSQQPDGCTCVQCAVVLLSLAGSLAPAGKHKVLKA